MKHASIVASEDSVDKERNTFKPLSQYESEVGETIKLEIMTGTEYICKCGKPKDIKMCFAVDDYEKISDKLPE